jgi:hypothetical protein
MSVKPILLERPDFVKREGWSKHESLRSRYTHYGEFHDIANSQFQFEHPDLHKSNMEPSFRMRATLCDVVMFEGDIRLKEGVFRLDTLDVFRSFPLVKCCNWVFELEGNEERHVLMAWHRTRIINTTDYLADPFKPIKNKTMCIHAEMGTLSATKSATWMQRLAALASAWNPKMW